MVWPTLGSRTAKEQEQERTITCVIGVGSPAGARRGRGDHRLDPAPFPADDGTPSPPADDQHSRQWRAQNGRGERDRGSATAIGPQTTGQGITASPRRTSLDNRSTSCVGWARETAGSGRVSGAVAHVSKSRHAGRRRDAIADRMPGMGGPEATGPPSDAADIAGSRHI